MAAKKPVTQQEDTVENSRRTQAERRKKAEARMLNAAIHLIAEKGFSGLTLNEVGERAGYSRGLPAHYFGQKHALVTEMVAQIIKQFVTNLRQSTTHAHTRGLSVLLHAADAYIEGSAQDPIAARAFSVMLTEATNHPERFPGIIKLNRQSAKSFAEHIRAGQESGEIRPQINADAQAILILGQLRGTVAQWLMDTDAISVETIRSAFADTLKRSLQA